MPSDEVLKQQAEEWKTKGNDAFQKGSIEDAIQAYSQGVVLCDRLIGGVTVTTTPASTTPSPIAALKATLLSNRAMCYLKGMRFQPCIDDCTTALGMEPEAKLRAKVLFRRAKSRFLLSNLRDEKPMEAEELRQEAAKDLLLLLQYDPKNSEANQLLVTVRAQHKMKQQETKSKTTPVSKTLNALEQRNDIEHNLKILIGLLDNDTSNASMELGRCGGVDVLFQLSSECTGKTAVFAVQCISHAGSHPAFVRAYLNDVEQHQKRIFQLVESKQDNDTDILVSLLAVLDRIILHLDRDDPNKDISGTTGLDYTVIMNICNAALKRPDKTVIRAVLDVLTFFTAGTERDTSIRASLGTMIDPLMPVPVTAADERAMTPQETAVYRKRRYEKKTRDEAWAFERGILFGKSCMRNLIKSANACSDHVIRREVTVVVGRILAGIAGETEDEKCQELVRPFLQDVEKESMGVIIEEVHNDDEEEEKNAAVEEINNIPLETMMERAIITCALLLSKKELGAWAFGPGWKNSIDELEKMIDSGDGRAMCLASEVISAAATLESAGQMISGLISGGYMQKLIKSDDRDIRSGAASAVAKVGLADKSTKADEGEVMSLLQGACDLLEDKGEKETKDDGKGTKKLHHFSSFATSSVERGIEMINYLVANTFVKEELAAGFQTMGVSHTALERLVEVSSLPNAGESLSGFGLASIFQHLAVTNLQLRKEMFEGKEVTMEQYDEMQKMGKTEEEKELMEMEKDPDTQDACNERIRKLAAANVPRALVTLMEGASDHTLEQLIMCMSRMAGEASVRGILIQQGVLSACIKIEKNEGPTETDTMKKVIRLARHTIAKLLITMNPSLLTSAQRLGSVRPLLQLVRDIKASDLQHFEALLAITNIASSGEDAKNRIISEKGLAPLNFAMFSDHEKVQQAATEAMCNLVPHKAMMEHLAVPENIKLWLAFASDYEERYECARAAAGCLAMATQDEMIALALTSTEKFGLQMRSMLESGRLEIMHRALYIVLNLVLHGGDLKEDAVKETLIAFCEAYVASYHNGTALEGLEFSDEEQSLLPVTIEVAKKILSTNDEK